ncbi:MAG TPA: metallophosphoesterase [Spirochaetota bacterium]|nr:metallophosphoesterase [Spirochaetota bacterium]HQI38751.1 metallophosphoesterase [Spirochaetota bacterium]HQK08057.1 metallophosphoesterase [Spirochaetota bacterium]HRR60574.1 metallophosphoesterase [Spirochaetota bacterium]
MRSSTFYIIFASIIAFYLIANYYILTRIQKLVPQQFKLFTVAGIAILALSFIMGRILERYTVCATSDFLVWIGALWIALFLYLLLGFLLTDSIAAITGIFFNISNVKRYAYTVIIILSFAVTVAGYINELKPVVKEINITIHKPSSLKQLRIAYASDIHLGSIIANSRLENLVTLINNSNPDIIIFGGDIVDEDIKPVIENNLGELLLQLKANHGIIAVPGNHEYIGGIDKAMNYIKSHNIKILRDELFTINDIQIIGRDDRSKFAFTGEHRAPLEHLIKKVNTNHPLIIIDHQPFAIAKTASYPVDLLLSGHSHHGQLFPFNYITSKLYQISWGYDRINNTHVYVSCGYGTWGPPVRTNSVSEIVILNLFFQ